MAYGDTWPAPNPNEWHIESTVSWIPNEDPQCYHILVRGDRMFEGRYIWRSIVAEWLRRSPCSQ